MKFSPKHTGIGALVLILSITVQLGTNHFNQSTLQSNILSVDSIKELRKLNQENDMVFSDQSMHLGLDSILMNDVLQANPKNTEPNGHPGLIISLEKKEKEFLILEPQTRLTNTELKSLAKTYKEAIPEFKHVEADQPIHLTSHENIKSPQTTTTNAIPMERTTREKPRIAIIDSGIDTTHSRFKRIEWNINPNANVIDQTSDVYDDVSHGTHIAGIIALRAPNSIFLPYKIVNKKGGHLSDILTALELAIEDDADLINMSLGVLDHSPALESLLEKASEREIIVVAAAGNFSTDRAFYPAKYDSTLAVASIDKKGDKMKKSNFGSWVDVAAPGEKIVSALPNGEYGKKSGTSQASAYITAILAKRLRTNPDTSIEKILTTLSENNLVIQRGSLQGTPILRH